MILQIQKWLNQFLSGGSSANEQAVKRARATDYRPPTTKPKKIFSKNFLTKEIGSAKVVHNKTMKKRVSTLMLAKRVRTVKADMDKMLKCISEFGELKVSRLSRELPIQGQGLIEPFKVYLATNT